ncbi:hypothetical protein [Archangium sp.]|uniref:hypothetical protein n=1 Tax=Archangium sp. TaxID=1872627 RepID=UPI002EDB503E
MKRALGWTIVLGMGAALATGCVSRQEEGAKQVGAPYTPIQQKYKSPSASEAESGMGGSGQSQSSDQLAMPDHWQDHPADSNRENSNRDNAGVYTLSRPQAVPKERQSAPLGVGGGVDSARTMAREQLKSY